MPFHLKFKAALLCCALAAPIFTAEAMEVGPNPKHAWDFSAESKSAWLGQPDSDDVPIIFDCKESGIVETTYVGYASDDISKAKDGSKASLTLRQNDGTEIKVAGTLAENVMNGGFDLIARYGVNHPLIEFLKGDGIVEIEAEPAYQPKGGYKQRISLKGAQQVIEKLQKTCGGSTSSASSRPAHANSSPTRSEPTSEQVRLPSVSALEAALKCNAKFKPERIIGDLQREKVIEQVAVDGGDGIPRIRAQKPTNLFGMRVITVSGWNETGKMFSRTPGTAPPVHVGITVEGTEKGVEAKLREQGVHVTRPGQDTTPRLYVLDDPFLNPKLVWEFKGRTVVTITCSLGW